MATTKSAATITVEELELICRKSRVDIQWERGKKPAFGTLVIVDRESREVYSESGEFLASAIVW